MPRVKSYGSIEPILQELKKRKAIKTSFPGRLKPMLATKVNTPFDDADWIFEVKWDGYRILSHKNGNKIELLTREQQDYTEIYDSITESLKKFNCSFILDGEVIMPDEKGKPSFDDLQQVRQLGSSRLVYCVFDILWLQGYSLLTLPLFVRKKILQMLLPYRSGNIINYPFVRENGNLLFEEMALSEMEGIVAKKKHIRLPAR